MKSEITKEMLCTSLKKHLAYKTLDKISIREITDDCGLNRQTFYYHFDDIYQLMAWQLKTDAVSIFLDQGDKLDWKKSLTRLFDYILANRNMCNNALASLGNEYIYRFFYDELYAIILNNLDILPIGKGLDQNKKAQLAKYYVISWGSYIVAWMMGVVEESPEEIIEFLISQLGNQNHK
jgi:AcrR family transcriptional regulator